jgi:predicted aspartyl protease
VRILINHARCLDSSPASEQINVPRRATRALGVARRVILFVVTFAASGVCYASAQDLPPPPGTLERELSLPPLSKPAATDGPRLSSPIEIPFILEGGHVIIEASIEGNTPVPFMFDTGGRDTITPDAAQSLNAPVERSERIGGIGPKVWQSNMIRVGRVAIGAAMLEHQLFYVIDLPNTLVDRGSRPRLAGLIGSELLARYTVTLDYARATLTLNNPGFRPQQAAFSLPLGFSMSRDGLTHPSISAELDDVAGEFILDTGANSQVFVSEKFQREHAPFAQYAKVLNFLSAGGIGGRANMHLGFGKHLHFGSATLSPPTVTGTTDASSGNLNASGLLGAGILTQFVVTVDYHSLRAYFEPVPGRTLPPVLRGTGLIIDKPEHELFEVLDTFKGTAAARAGLHHGDHIVEVAGRAARDLSVSDVSVLSDWRTHTSLTVRTSDQRRFDLGIAQFLP